MSTGQEQVQVRFVTKQTKYAVSDSAIFVPVSFKRYGLSEIINNLLGFDKPIPFDFLIDGAILRSSISEYLSEENLSTENLLTIEYVESMLPPTQLAAFQHDDWISSVKGGHGFFLTGSYDNIVRLWNTSGECVSSMVGHKDSVKCVTFGPAQEQRTTIYSGSLDQSILAWEYNAEAGESLLLYECKGHSGSVEAVDTDKRATMLASASTDGTIKVWTTSTNDITKEEHISKNESSKKRKVEKTHKKIKNATTTLEGHVGAVNAVVFGDTVDSLYSGGWDNSVRLWNVEQQVNTVTKVCEKVVLSVDHASRNGLVATGHADNVIRLWDMRTEDGINVKLTLQGHTEWVSSVSWSDQSEYTLCSGSYDSTVRVWDIRSKQPLYTVEAGRTDEKDKVYSVHWHGQHILSGGEDKQLRIFDAKSSAK